MRCQEGEQQPEKDLFLYCCWTWVKGTFGQACYSHSSVPSLQMVASLFLNQKISEPKNRVKPLNSSLNIIAYILVLKHICICCKRAVFPATWLAQPINTVRAGCGEADDLWSALCTSSMGWCTALLCSSYMIRTRLAPIRSL